MDFHYIAILSENKIESEQLLEGGLESLEDALGDTKYTTIFYEGLYAFKVALGYQEDSRAFFMRGYQFSPEISEEMQQLVEGEIKEYNESECSIKRIKALIKEIDLEAKSLGALKYPLHLNL
jgi:hypothetical protein